MESEVTFKGIKIQKTIATMLEKEMKSMISLIESEHDSSTEYISSLLRALHRLKGSTGFIGLSEIENHIRTIEHGIKSSSSINIEDMRSFSQELRKYQVELTNVLF